MVIIVMGVSGSGKTTIGRALAERLGWRFVDADDWHPPANIEKMRSSTPLTDIDRELWLRSLNGMIAKWIGDGENAVLACSALRSSYRNILSSGIADQSAIRFVYLKGVYEDIAQRLKLRTGHFMPESLLRSQFDTLEEPSEVEALAIDTRRPVDQSVTAIIDALHLKTPPDSSHGRDVKSH